METAEVRSELLAFRPRDLAITRSLRSNEAGDDTSQSVDNTQRV